LQADSVLLQQYEALKYQLAAKFLDDREAYTSAKSDFVMSIVNSE